MLDFYLLSFYGADVVPGVSWPATLGPVITDYKSKYFEFSLDGCVIVGLGIHPLMSSLCNYKPLGV